MHKTDDGDDIDDVLTRAVGGAAELGGGGGAGAQALAQRAGDGQPPQARRRQPAARRQRRRQLQGQSVPGAILLLLQAYVCCILRHFRSRCHQWCAAGQNYVVPCAMIITNVVLIHAQLCMYSSCSFS